MGQQQLLMIILGVIIVGVAVVAGIGMFNAHSEEAVKDQLVSQSLVIGANAQQFYKRPTSMGGGSLTFTGYAIPNKMTATTDCGVINATTGATTTPGYVLTAGTQQISITATPNAGLGYNWVVTATVTPTNITTTIGAATAATE